MKPIFPIIGLLLTVTVAGVAEMKTWTFQKTGKTMQGEVVSFAGDAVTMRLPDGKAYTVPIAYLAETNRVALAAERAKLWKEVEIVKLEGTMSAGRYKKCTVEGKEVKGAILIDILPAAVEAILNSRNQQAAEILELSDRIENRDRAVKRADAVTPVVIGGGEPGYVDAVTEQRKKINLAFLDLEDAKANLAKLQAAYADYIEKTRAATIVKIRNVGLVYQELPVWECPDPRKPQP